MFRLAYGLLYFLFERLKLALMLDALPPVLLGGCIGAWQQLPEERAHARAECGSSYEERA
ncbi:MAG: hypothetical protein ACJAUD_001476 [Crocinitomicaceae bacterium]|jgi:hypothetical protein